MLYPSSYLLDEVKKISARIQSRQLEVEAGARLLIELAPDWAAGYLLLATALDFQSRHDEAEPCFWSALEREPCQPAAFHGFAFSLTELDQHRPLARAMRELTIRKLAVAEDVQPYIPEMYRKLYGDSKLDLASPESFARLAKGIEERLKTDPWPADVVKRLLPYQLLTDVQTQAGNGVDPAVLARILRHAGRCAPVWRAAIREWVRNDVVSLSDLAAMAVIAIFGEIGDESAISELLELIEVNDSDLFHHVEWAIWRLGQRFPSEASNAMRAALPRATVSMRAAIADQLGLLPPGTVDHTLVSELLEDFPHDPDPFDQAYLLLSLQNVLYHHGEGHMVEVLISPLFRKMTDPGKKAFKGIAPAGERGFPVSPLFERFHQWSIEDVVCGGVLLGEEQEKDDWDGERDLPDDDFLAPAVAPARPGRNDPCWCGSGKKYKKCHLDQDDQGARQPSKPVPVPLKESVAAVATEAAAARELFGKILDATRSLRSRAEFAEALELFLGEDVNNSDPGELEQGCFFDWFVYDYRPSSTGRTAVDDYLRRNRHNINARERAQLESWRHAVHGLYEVQRLEPGEGLEVKNLLSGEVLFVSDVSSSRSLSRWDCLLARVERTGNGSKFVGNGLIVHRTILPELRRFIEIERKKQDAAAFVRSSSHLVIQKLRELTQRQKNITLVNAENDPIEFSAATWEVLNEPALLAALRSHPELVEDTEEDSRDFSFAWLGPREKDGRRVYGHLKVEHGRLRLECNSRQRLGNGHRLIESMAGKDLRHVGDSFESQKALLERAAKEPSGKGAGDTPAGSAEMVLEFKASHYAKWPDRPLPGLGGRTPREAVRRAGGREQVLTFIRNFENSEDRERKEGRPAFDFTPLRKELGLLED